MESESEGEIEVAKRDFDKIRRGLSTVGASLLFTVCLTYTDT